HLTGMILRRGEARVAWQCGVSRFWKPAKIRNDATAQKNPACGAANRFPGFVAALARCPASRFAPGLPARSRSFASAKAGLPGKPIRRHQIDSIWPDSALADRKGGGA
ncbi:MAG: hypothetical protein V3S88_00270, partial [Alphaproteobacteria bacterium]